MAINFNEEFKNQAYGPIDAGDYEVEISKLEPKTSAAGKPYLSISFRIRDDVDQKFKGRYIWKTLFLDSNEKYAKEGWYETTELYYLLQTQPGGTTNFETPDECLVYLGGTATNKLHMVVTVEKMFDDNTGEEKNSVKKHSYRPSVWDMQKHDAPAVADTNAGVAPTDEELPF